MILDQVTSLIAKEYNVDAAKLAPSTRLVEDLNVDSLDAVELMMRIEDVFNFKISDQEAQTLKTVEDIVRLVTARTAA